MRAGQLAGNDPRRRRLPAWQTHADGAGVNSVLIGSAIGACHRGEVGSSSFIPFTYQMKINGDRRRRGVWGVLQRCRRDPELGFQAPSPHRPPLGTSQEGAGPAGPAGRERAGGEAAPHRKDITYDITILRAS